MYIFFFLTSTRTQVHMRGKTSAGDHLSTTLFSAHSSNEHQQQTMKICTC